MPFVSRSQVSHIRLSLEHVLGWLWLIVLHKINKKMVEHVMYCIIFYLVDYFECCVDVVSNSIPTLGSIKRECQGRRAGFNATFTPTPSRGRAHLKPRPPRSTINLCSS